MKKIMLALVAVIGIMTLGLNAYESYTVNSIGNFDYVNGSNGSYGIGQRIGDFYYFNQY